MIKELKAEVRDQLTKGATNRMRKEGRIPAVIYGHGEPVAVSVNERDFANNFKKISENEIINLELAGGTRKVLIKDCQRNYLKGTIMHLDFLEITKGHKLRTHVPIKIVGTAPGTRDGGILEHSLHALDVECVSEKLPENIEIDVSALSAGHAIHVRDIKVAAGIKILNNADQVVASIAHVRAEAAPAAAAAVEAAPAAPAK